MRAALMMIDALIFQIGVVHSKPAGLTYALVDPDLPQMAFKPVPSDSVCR